MRTCALLQVAEALKLLHDVADEATAGLLEVLWVHALPLVAATKLHAQLAHTEALANVHLAQHGGWAAAGARQAQHTTGQQGAGSSKGLVLA